MLTTYMDVLTPTDGRDELVNFTILAMDVIFRGTFIFDVISVIL